MHQRNCWTLKRALGCPYKGNLASVGFRSDKINEENQEP